MSKAFCEKSQALSTRQVINKANWQALSTTWRLDHNKFNLNTFVPILEVNPCRKLQVAREKSAAGCAEACTCIVVVGVHAVQVDTVEQIKCVESEFEVDMLGNGRGLFHS